MKKIIISTYNNSKNNYGAVFQAYSLSFFLKKINCIPFNITIKKRTKNNTIIGKFKNIIVKIINFPFFLKICRRKKGFENFIKETQNLIIYKNYKKLYKNPPIGDLYVTGSDQVWNPLNIMDDFFLKYVPNNCKKISYAASMGNEIVPLHELERFKKNIENIDYFSVREDTLINVIGQFTNKKIIQNIDPVFLTSKREWLENVKEYKKLKFANFILVYAIEWNDNFNKELEKLKRKYNLPVVCINLGNINKVKCDQIIRDASPYEFLYLLNKCNIMVSTSFHGIALSIILHKKLLILCGNDKSSRIKSLMRLFKINKEINFENLLNDYDEIDKIINCEIEKSKNYLLEMIK